MVSINPNGLCCTTSVKHGFLFTFATFLWNTAKVVLEIPMEILLGFFVFKTLLFFTQKRLDKIKPFLIYFK